MADSADSAPAFTDSSAATVNVQAACTDPNRRADSNWQAHKSLVQCNQHLFAKKEAADVTFSVEYENGPSKDKAVKIPAHRLILLSRSPVFHAMFCGEIPFTDQEITINDVEPDALKEVLRYMYYDEVDITPDNVLFVIYASKKYMLPALADKCVAFLEHRMSAANVCSILEHSIFFGEHDLVHRALEVIQANLVEVLETNSFTNLSTDALGKILELENVSAEEVDIFAACMAWVSAECDRQKLEDMPENQRKLLGKLLYKIRFPAMSIEQFADVVVPTGLLHDHEGYLIFQYFACQSKPPVEPFTSTRRRGQQKKPGRLVIPGPHASKTVAPGYTATVTLYCLVSKAIKIQNVLVHDCVRRNQVYSRFEVRVFQEQEEKCVYSNGEADTEMITIDARTASKLPMKDVIIKAGKFKMQIDHWVLHRKTSNLGSGHADLTLHFSESEKAFLAADNILNLKIGSLREMPLLGLDYQLC